MNILRGIIGLIILIAIAVIFSKNRKAIDWKLVITGLILQIALAILVFEVPPAKWAFTQLAIGFAKITDFTNVGSKMLFEGLLNTESVGFMFAFQVLPTIIFFSALSSLLYYLGILQKVVYGFAWIMNKTMRLSGAESLSAAANIFVGQTEAPLVVKPYIKDMTKSEIMSLMTGGMATIAGGVLVSYIIFLGGENEASKIEFATHLLTASIMSAPAALIIAKILVPETGEVNKKLDINNESVGSNALEAISNGTTEGVKLAVNVGAMLLVFTAFVAMFNYLTKDIIGDALNVNTKIAQATGGKFDGMSLEWLFGYLFAPLSWVIGIAKEDLLIAGQLLGEKTILNEYIAYASLKDMISSDGSILSERSIYILTYALCGFSNIASIGIQIGGISILAPNQKTTLAKLGVYSLIGGTLACLMTAAIAGIFF